MSNMQDKLDPIIMKVQIVMGHTYCPYDSEYHFDFIESVYLCPRSAEARKKKLDMRDQAACNCGDGGCHCSERTYYTIFERVIQDHEKECVHVPFVLIW